jgi:hypothetical protein
MATRSRLRAKVGSKFLKPIYCHWDGYPEHMLPTLNDNYNTDEKVSELMALGNLSFLDAKVKPDEGQEHSFDKPAEGVTIAYHRDRGEKLEFWKDRQEYNYIYSDGVWKLE